MTQRNLTGPQLCFSAESEYVNLQLDSSDINFAAIVSQSESSESVAEGDSVGTCVVGPSEGAGVNSCCRSQQLGLTANISWSCTALASARASS